MRYAGRAAGVALFWTLAGVPGCGKPVALGWEESVRAGDDAMTGTVVPVGAMTGTTADGPCPPATACAVCEVRGPVCGKSCTVLPTLPCKGADNDVFDCRGGVIVCIPHTQLQSVCLPCSPFGPDGGRF